jgi:regulator of sigma E protease
MAGKQAQKGFADFLFLMAAISVNLGVLNLLPIPVLDGGSLVFMAIEALRRKPLSERSIMTAQKVGLALLLTLMVFVTYNDLVRVFTGKGLP